MVSKKERGGRRAGWGEFFRTAFLCVTCAPNSNTCIYVSPLSACILIDKQGIYPTYKVTLCLLLSPCNCILYIGLENVKWNLLCGHLCLDVSVHVIVCTCLGREDDSKCHFVVWGQPSQTHSSCRRCCHPPPHCLCKWCLQSPSNTWRFHPPAVTLLLCLCLRLYKLSHRPSASALPASLLSLSTQKVWLKRTRR